MRTSRIFSSVAAVTLAACAPAAVLKLNVTTVATDNGASVLECWQMDNPFSGSENEGTTGAMTTLLSSTKDTSLTIVPPNFVGGLHNAPYIQFTIFLSGLAHITFPDDSADVYIEGGEFGIVLATDVVSLSQLGHNTSYPGDVESVALEIPTKGNVIPPHHVLHKGPCEAGELGGYRDRES